MYDRRGGDGPSQIRVFQYWKEASLGSYLVIDLSHIALSRGLLDQAWSNMGAPSHERNLKGGFDAERGKGLASKGMFSSKQHLIWMDHSDR